MRPNEFWDLAPCEAVEFLEESQRRSITEAWWIGKLVGMGVNSPKKYPHRPDLLWNKDADLQTPEVMRQIMLAVADNAEDFKRDLQKNGKLH